MTPDSARPLPTIAAASTRGRRATKNTWASTLSANGIVRSRTRERRMDVLPTSGARRQTKTVTTPKVAIVANSRRRTSVGARNGDHRQMAGTGMNRDVGVHAVQDTNVAAREHLGGLALRDHAPGP